MILRENDATDARLVRPEQNRPPWPISGRRTAFIKRGTDRSR